MILSQTLISLATERHGMTPSSSHLSTAIGQAAPIVAEITLNKDVLLIIGIGLIAFWFLVRANRKPRGETNLLPEEQIERLRQSHGMRGDLDRAMEEIEDLTKRLGDRLDQKSRSLERLLAEADEKIAELKRLKGEPAAPAAPSPLKFSSHANVSPMSDDPLARSVYDLFDAGHAPIEIAKRLNEQIGKVELILALRRA